MIRRAAFLLLLLATAVGAGPVEAGAAPEAGSALVGCDQAGARVTVSVDSHLDPSCSYAGIDVTGSDVTLDCQGALVHGELSTPGAGILVTTPVAVPQTGVTVRGCRTEGFTNGIRVTRDGFRLLPAGAEYDAAGGDITIEDTTVTTSRGVGIFVDGYVRGVTIQRVTVDGAGSSGVYLEAGSVDGAVLDSRLVGNGFIENGDEGSLFDAGDTTFRYWGPGREGLSIDGSRGNVIRGNTIAGNSAGGIFAYTNCGEFVDERPERWYERRYGAEDNLIEDNAISGGRTGVWLGSRMSENVYPMDCSQQPYVDDGVIVRVLDRAAGNTVRGNAFSAVTYGVRVEDDDAVVEDNTFAGPSADRFAVYVGTGPRTAELDHPVRGLRLAGNRSTIAGNADPYRWSFGHEGTVEGGNTALGAAAPLCEGPGVPVGTFIFVEALAVQPPGEPPVARPPGGTPDVGVLPACPRAGDPTEPPPTTLALGPATAPPATPVVTDARFTG